MSRLAAYRSQSYTHHTSQASSAHKPSSRLRYLLYARKSTESADRQVLSIRAQIKESQRAFPDIKIVDVLEERHSAFHPQSRPVFQSMIERIKRGEADGIICWHPDRLSRNEVDAATLTFLLRTGVIKDLRFVSYFFVNTPEGIMMLQMALSQSQFSSSKLSVDVKRGNRDKYEIGGITWPPPQGYLNDKANHTIIKDPERFDLVQKMWHLLLTGSYSVPQIWRMATEEWHFTTRKEGLRGGKLISLSTMYGLFRNPLYCGLNIRPDGTAHQCTHPLMITEEQFWCAQAILGIKGRPRPKSHSFAFTGLMRCGECGCAITAENKMKVIKTTGKVHFYTYYHCTKKKRGQRCSQPCIEIKEMERQIDDELAQMEITPEFKEWAIEYLRQSQADNQKKLEQMHQGRQRRLEALEQQMNTLLDMRMRELIDDSEYLLKKEELQKEQRHLQEALQSSEQLIGRGLELGQNVFDFACHSRERFQSGTQELKRTILQTLSGSNLQLLDKKLVFEPVAPYCFLKNVTENSLWQGAVENVRTYCVEENNRLESEKKDSKKRK